MIRFSKTSFLIIFLVISFLIIGFFAYQPARADGQPSSVYDGQSQSGPVINPSPIPCSGEETVLLIQDNIPWYAPADQDPLGANVTELKAQNKDFCIITSDEIDTADLAPFPEIIISAAQVQSFYDNLFPGGIIHPALTTYVQNGGILSANLTAQVPSPGAEDYWEGMIFIGGLDHIHGPTNNNNIVLSSHPIITGEFGGANGGQIQDTAPLQDIDWWLASSHGYFTNLPANTQVIMTDQLNRPVLIEYPFGEGIVIASQLTSEWRYAGGYTYLNLPQNKKLLANEIGYQDSLVVPTLIKKYAPNLWFDFEEKYYPISPFFYTDDIDETSGEKSRNNYLALSLRKKLDNFTIYYHTVETEEEIVYEYWFYYAYNHWWNKHYHDWETVFVFVDKNTGKVNRVVGSAHEWWYPNNIGLENPEKDHAQILIEEGSHASYVDGDEDGKGGLLLFGLTEKKQDLSNPVKAWGIYSWEEQDRLYGVKINYTKPYYKLQEITSGFIAKFKGLETFPDSPTTPTYIYVLVHLVPLPIIVLIDGYPPKHPWTKDEEGHPYYPEYYNPEEIIPEISNTTEGKISLLDGGNPLGAIAVILSEEPLYTFADEEGNFLINNVPLGAHDVVVNLEGYAPYKQRFILEESMLLGVDGVLNLVPEPEAFRIEGIMKDVGGNPIPNATVNIYNEDEVKLFTTLTDENGQYLVITSSEHTYSVEAISEDKKAITYNITGEPGDMVEVSLKVATPKSLKETTITKLEESKTGDRRIDRNIDRVIKYIKRSLEDKRDSLWQNDWHLKPEIRNIKAFSWQKKAVRTMLRELCKCKRKWFFPCKKLPPQVEETFKEVINDLLEADKLLALTILEDAKATPVTDPKFQKIVTHLIEKAEKEYNKALEELEKPLCPEFKKHCWRKWYRSQELAITKFSKSWSFSQLAVKLATKEFKLNRKYFSCFDIKELMKLMKDMLI